MANPGAKGSTPVKPAKQQAPKKTAPKKEAATKE